MRSMRFHAALLLIGLLAFRALPTDAAGRYNVLGIGADSCGTLTSGSGAEGSVPYGMWFAPLLRVTCNLDSVLLRVESYSRANSPDDGEELTDRVMARSRPRTRAGG